MLAAVSLLCVVAMSVIVTRVAAAMLVHTGISRDMARFQARSAFSGTGFATAEAEALVNHPIRRRIISSLMMFGNVGIVTTASTLILAFVNKGESDDTWEKVGILTAGLLILWLAASSRWLDRRLMRFIEWAIEKITRLDVSDYEGLLHLDEEYRVVEVVVGTSDWIAGKRLAESGIRAEGLLVLAIRRPDGGFVGAPVATTEILAGDTLLIYGKLEGVQALDRRKQGTYGDRDHLRAVEARQEELQQATVEDQRRTERLRQSQIMAKPDVAGPDDGDASGRTSTREEEKERVEES